jgi:hypothetical protein
MAAASDDAAAAEGDRDRRRVIVRGLTQCEPVGWDCVRDSSDWFCGGRCRSEVSFPRIAPRCRQTACGKKPARFSSRISGRLMSASGGVPVFPAAWAIGRMGRYRSMRGQSPDDCGTPGKRRGKGISPRVGSPSRCTHRITSDNSHFRTENRCSRLPRMAESPGVSFTTVPAPPGGVVVASEKVR